MINICNTESPLQTRSDHTPHRRSNDAPARSNTLYHAPRYAPTRSTTLKHTLTRIERASVKADIGTALAISNSSIFPFCGIA
jgi:hypothetical protein